MNMKAIWFYVIAFVVVFLIASFGNIYMRSNQAKATGEDFNTFYERFLTDSTFQLSRINFPLEGLPSGASETDFENGYYWTEDNWDIHIKFDYDDEGYERKIAEFDGYIIEMLIHPQGWGLERRFTQIDEKWKLTYYAASNAVKRKDGARPS